MSAFDFSGHSVLTGLLSLLYWVPALLAIIDYFRRRPEWYWFWVIIFFPTLGALIYFIVVVLPSSAVEEAVVVTFKEKRRRNELEALAESSPTPGHLAELGEIYFKERKYSKAVETLERAVAMGIDHEDALYFLGRSYEKTGELKKAVDSLIAVVRKNPNFRFGEAFLALGRMLQADGQLRDAEAAYREVLKNHTYAEARYRLAILLAERGREDEAVQLMKSIVTDSKGQPFFIVRKERKFVSLAKSWLQSK